jgi:hypothetical protein
MAVVGETQMAIDIRRVEFSLSPPVPQRQCPGSPSHVPYQSLGRAHAACMPDAARAVNGCPPGSSQNGPVALVLTSTDGVSTHKRQSACAHRSSSRPTPGAIEPRLFPRRSPQRSSANAAVGGLKPPPAGRLRRASNPSSPAQHRIKEPFLHKAPFRARGAPCYLTSEASDQGFCRFVRRVAVTVSGHRDTVGSCPREIGGGGGGRGVQYGLAYGSGRGQDR